MEKYVRPRMDVHSNELDEVITGDSGLFKSLQLCRICSIRIIRPFFHLRAWPKNPSLLHVFTSSGPCASSFRVPKKISKTELRFGAMSALSLETLDSAHGLNTIYFLEMSAKEFLIQSTINFLGAIAMDANSNSVARDSCWCFKHSASAQKVRRLLSHACGSTLGGSLCAGQRFPYRLLL